MTLYLFYQINTIRKKSAVNFNSFPSTVKGSLTVGWTDDTNHNEVLVDLHSYLLPVFDTKDLKRKIIGPFCLSKRKIVVPIVTCKLYSI